MNLSKIPAGKKLPDEFNVVIEIPMNSDPVKYELDKESGAIFVDRFVHTPMFYPCNYGFVPQTLGDDGDPVDVMLVSRYPLLVGSVIAARPIGVLIMEDESGMDEKIIAVPTTKVYRYFEEVKTTEDLPKHLLAEIRHFFEHYKDLEPGKWVKLKDILGIDEAKKIVQKAFDAANK